MRADMGLYDAFLCGIETGGNSPSVLYMNKTIRRFEVKRNIDLAADALKCAGIKKGEIITICLPNIPQAMYLIYGVNKAGGVSHLLHPLTGAEQLKQMLERTGSKTLFALESFCGDYITVCRELNVRLISCNPADALNIIKRTVYRFKNKKLADIENYKSFVKTAKNKDGLIFEHLAPKDTALLLNSGGTGGEPKTVELSAFAINSLAKHGPYILNVRDAVGKYMLSVLPYFHGFGLCMGLHAMTCFGGCNVMIPKFKKNEAVGYVRKGKINYMIGVPALYGALLSHPKFSGKCLKNIDIAFVGGDFVPQTVIDAFNARMTEFDSGGRLFEGYGLTECVTVCTVNIHSCNMSGTVGKPLPGIEIKAFMTDSAKMFVDAAKGAQSGGGELCMRGDTLMNGYYKDSGASEKIKYTDDAGGAWLSTGDFGYVDGQGFVHFKQRIKRIIKISGVSVFPAEIEQVISEVGGVNQVCAYDAPDIKRGSVIKLAVETPRTDTEAMRKEIMLKIKTSVPAEAVIAEIAFVSRLPLTKMNKIDIEALKRNQQTTLDHQS